MNNNRLFLDLHIIQTLPPSNINRDDTGSPKTAQYGGVRRTRVSSQAWKKAMRTYFNDNGEKSNVGIRTLEIVEYVARKIKALDCGITDEEAINLSNEVFKNVGISTKDNKAKALFFLGDIQAEQLAKATLENCKDKTALKKILSENPSIDIALFGRMVADDPSLNEDASSQVAHAISTHAIQNEFDFFTAVDDLSKEDNAGAGMLGTVEYNSATLYRYANVAVHDLNRQLKDKNAVINTLKLFVESFANSLPTGKINSFANQTLPQMILVTLRGDRPVSLVSAFETPVKSKDGYAEKSIEKLAEEFKKSEKFTDEAIYTSYVTICGNDEMSKIGEEKKNKNDLLNSLGEKLNELINTYEGE